MPNTRRQSSAAPPADGSAVFSTVASARTNHRSPALPTLDTAKAAAANRPNAATVAVLGSVDDDDDDRSLGEVEGMYTPRPHIISADLVQAHTTAERMTLAISTIAQLKTELNASRTKVSDLLTMKSMTLQQAVQRMSDVFSSSCATYQHPCFQDTVLAFQHPTTRWFIGLGDGDADTPYPYLRACGRQRNQRFSLGAVKWHIQTFFAQSPPSWRAGTGNGGERLEDRLQRWLDGKYHGDGPSMSYSFHTSLEWFAAADTDCFLIKNIIDGHLDESWWRRGQLTASRLRTEMEKMQAQLVVRHDPSARITAAAAVDEILQGSVGETAANGEGGPIAQAQQPATEAATRPIRKRRTSAVYINDQGLPQRCLVATPKTVNADLAIEAINTLFPLWSQESQSELVRALENTAMAAQEAAAGMHAKKGGGGVSAPALTAAAAVTAPSAAATGGHRKSILTSVVDGPSAIPSAPSSSHPAPSLKGSAASLSLAYLFDPVMIGGGQMESYFTSAIRTLWLLESYQLTTDIIDATLERLTSASGRVTPQLVVTAVMDADEECPPSVVHDLVENIFEIVKPTGLPLSDESKDAPISDRYLQYEDVSLALKAFVNRLRRAGPMRHTRRQVYLHHLQHRAVNGNNTSTSTSGDNTTSRGKSRHLSGGGSVALEDE